MAMQPDIQYVPFCYVDGTAARKVQHQPAKKASATPAPKRRQAKRKVIAVDPVAIGGIVVAVVMLVMLLAGFAEYTAMQEKNLQMQNYLTSLQLENAQLQQENDQKFAVSDRQVALIYKYYTEEEIEGMMKRKNVAAVREFSQEDINTLIAHGMERERQHGEKTI